VFEVVEKQEFHNHQIAVSTHCFERQERKKTVTLESTMNALAAYVGFFTEKITSTNMMHTSK
jgi:hypothetical protein